MPAEGYQIQYAVSGRAACKQCKEKIGKDALRVARMVQSHLPRHRGRLLGEAPVEVNKLVFAVGNPSRPKAMPAEGYQIQYAVSGRAACKQCKEKIGKDALRVARMNRSFHFDGLQASWYHYACFWKKTKDLPAALSDLEGYHSLRPADQKKVKEKFESTAGQAVVVRAGDGGDYFAEYAKSSRSKCRQCLEAVMVGDVRLGKMVESDTVAFPIKGWFHQDCFFIAASNEGWGVMSYKNFDGYTDLRAETIAELCVLTGEDAPAAAGAGGKAKAKGKAKKGTKRGAAAAVEESPKAAKKARAAPKSKEEKALEKQTADIWKLRDSLKDVSNATLKTILGHNGLPVDGGRDKLLDRLVDGMLFGVLQPCSMCGGAMKVSEYGYSCSGFFSSWTRCSGEAAEVVRKPWKVPKAAKEEATALKKFKFKKRTRLFPERASLPNKFAAGAAAAGAGAAPAKAAPTGPPFASKTIVLAGRLGMTQKALGDVVKAAGGTPAKGTAIGKGVALVVVKNAEAGSSYLAAAREHNIPVVTEAFVHDCVAAGSYLPVVKYLVSRNDAVLAVKGSKSQAAAASTGGGGSGKSKSIKKVSVKGPAEVDPKCSMAAIAEVYAETPRGSKKPLVYSSTMADVDVATNRNAYYKLQLLHVSNRQWTVFRAWGRTGTTVGGTKEDDYGSKHSAKAEFERLYAEKTGNAWGEPFEKKAGKFAVVEIDYGVEDEDGVVDLTAGDADASSALHDDVQDLVRRLFDIESMKAAMLEFEIDSEKLPLGKLSRRQLTQALAVLSKLEALIKRVDPGGAGAGDPFDAADARTRMELADLNTQFYSIVPHASTSRDGPARITSLDQVSDKNLMVDSLMQIEVAQRVMSAGGSGPEHPLDRNYHSLDAKIVPIGSTEDDFHWIARYLTYTHGITHNTYTLKPYKVYRVDRTGSADRFIKLHNRRLLWHGSRLSNGVGLLSKGLLIAPPEAPVTGYMFGKGIYLADASSKSANYCRVETNKNGSNVGMLLLCDASLGDMHECQHAEYMEKPRPGTHSTWGQGRWSPLETKSSPWHTIDDGVKVPYNKCKESGVRSSLLYNEFIVYNVCQVRIKYLVMAEFEYNRGSYW